MCVCINVCIYGACMYVYKYMYVSLTNRLKLYDLNCALYFSVCSCRYKSSVFAISGLYIRYIRSLERCDDFVERLFELHEEILRLAPAPVDPTDVAVAGILVVVALVVVIVAVMHRFAVVEVGIRNALVKGDHFCRCTLCAFQESFHIPVER